MIWIRSQCPRNIYWPLLVQIKGPIVMKLCSVLPSVSPMRKLVIGSISFALIVPFSCLQTLSLLSQMHGLSKAFPKIKTHIQGEPSKFTHLFPLHQTVIATRAEWGKMPLWGKGLVCREITWGTQAKREGPKPTTPGLRARIRWI